MPPLVTLADAKDHLRVEQADVDHNSDIRLKVEQATAIILDYLKTQTTAIASISAADAAVITTVTPHGLTSGVTYTLADTTTTPTINGTQVVTVTGALTFTVPVVVTAGQADAAGTVASPSWTDMTVPGQVRAAILLMLTHLYEHRGDDQKTDADLWLAIEKLLMRSRDPALA